MSKRGLLRCLAWRPEISRAPGGAAQAHNAGSIQARIGGGSAPFGDSEKGGLRLFSLYALNEVLANSLWHRGVSKSKTMGKFQVCISACPPCDVMGAISMSFRA